MMAPVETIASTMLLPNEIDDNVLEARGEKRAGQAKNDRAIFIAQHRVVNLRGASEIARGKRHLAHRFDERDDVVFLDVDVLDNFNKQIGFFRFHDGLCLRHPGRQGPLACSVSITQYANVSNDHGPFASLKMSESALSSK